MKRWSLDKKAPGMFEAPKTGAYVRYQDVLRVLEDGRRLEWLLRHVSGAELRRIGIDTSGAGPDEARAAIDRLAAASYKGVEA